MKDKNLIMLAGLVLLLLYFNQKSLSIICSETPVYNNFATKGFDFTCGYNQGCTYSATCPSTTYPHPSSPGTLNYQESTRFYCANSDGNEMTNMYIIITITGRTCVQSGVILTPFYNQDNQFTTSEKTEVNVKVDGRGDGYIVHGLIKELNLQKDGYTSFGIATLDFGSLARGTYTIETWGQDSERMTNTFDVKGIMSLTSSFEPLQPYNNIVGYIYLKDENSNGLGINDVNNFDVKMHPVNGLNYFTFTCGYIGKDNILGGKWECSGNTNDYIGDVVIDNTVKKNGYADAIQHINVKTFIPSLVIEARCQDIDCPFPNSATLDDTKTFTFYIKHNNQLVDASTISVKVTNPSRTIVDKDITSSVLKTGTGTYQFVYGPFSEIEAHTFKIYATYPGTDPQTIYAKVAVTKEEPPVLFNPWILIIPVAIVGVILWLRRKR